MKISAAVAACALVVVACASSQEPKGEIVSVETTSASFTPSDSAIRLLSQQRCTHEAQCGRVGPDGPFTTMERCALATSLDERASIGLDACPYGVDPTRLRTCLDAIRARRCEEPMRALADVRGCDHFVLCR